MTRLIQARLRTDQESKLVALGVDNVQFRKGTRHPFIAFNCCGKHVRCIYNSDYDDPRVWHGFRFDEKLTDRHTYDFTRNGEIIIRLHGTDIYECSALMACTYEIVWTLLSWRTEADTAKDEIVAIFSRCTTYEEAAEELNQRPQLCAKAKQPKSAWPLIWGRVRRSRGEHAQTKAMSSEPADVLHARATEQPHPITSGNPRSTPSGSDCGGPAEAVETTSDHPKLQRVAAVPASIGQYALQPARESPFCRAGDDETRGPISGEGVEADEAADEQIDDIDGNSPEINEPSDQVVGQADGSQCCICGERWISGKVLIDGSVFHERCYSELTAHSQHLSLQKVAVVGELNKPTYLVGILTNWISSSRKHRNEMLRAQFADLSSQIDSITEKLRRLYDAWPSYPPDWEQRRQFAIQRDGKACAKCGAFEHLHLHHSRAIREGGTHRLTNLVLLCEDCHSDAHGGKTFRYQAGNGNQTSVEKRIGLISEAIAVGRDVHFRYEKIDGTITQRTVTPRELRKLSDLELKSLTDRDADTRKEGRLCLFGYCHLRRADRVFAIDRIRWLRFEKAR